VERPPCHPGQMLGRYRLVQRLARGGMGEVWLATASGSGGFTKRVVVKTILPERAADPAFVELLTREARMCGELNHPNLIEVFDFSEHDGIYAIAMEYVSGRSLSQIVRAAAELDQPIPIWCALRLIWEACRGLECAHEHGIIHCDLSPGNLMLSFGGVTKVLDFGVAHSHATGFKAERLKGKYHYMAPERVQSLVTDQRTDIYALGVILYVMLAGRLPVTAATDEALLLAIVHETPRPPSRYRALDREVEQVVLRAMAHDPSQRFQDVSSLLQAITQCREGQPAACSQLDMAMYLASLFPQAPELPAYIRTALRAAPERIDAEQTQRKASLFPTGATELDELVEFDSFSIDADDPFPGAQVEAPRALPSARLPSSAPEPLAVQRLFETSSSPRLGRGNLFGSGPIPALGHVGPGEGRPRGLFAAAALAAGSHPAAGPDAAPSETSGVFGPAPSPWPWSVSVIKPS
jgi:eukaryotic-like serine/threonine-protein kinase